MNLRFKKKINAHYSVNDFWIESVTLSLSSIHQVYVASLRNARSFQKDKRARQWYQSGERMKGWLAAPLEPHLSD